MMRTMIMRMTMIMLMMTTTMMIMMMMVMVTVMAVMMMKTELKMLGIELWPVSITFKQHRCPVAEILKSCGEKYS